MKKLVLTLLLILGGYAVSDAQNSDRIKSAIFSYLHDECGYETSYDSDGDIMFTMNDLVYYAIVKETGETYSFVEIRIAFESEKPIGELLEIANKYNKTHYLCKCSAEPNSFNISMEFAAPTTVQAMLQTRIALRWFPVWIDNIEEDI